jgi:hypothetical protein
MPACSARAEASVLSSTVGMGSDREAARRCGPGIEYQQVLPVDEGLHRTAGGKGGLEPRVSYIYPAGSTPDTCTVTLLGHRQAANAPGQVTQIWFVYPDLNGARHKAWVGASIPTG